MRGRERGGRERGRREREGVTNLELDHVFESQ